MVVMSREVHPFSCGTALSGGGPALLTAGCWNGFTAKSLWLPSLYSQERRLSDRRALVQNTNGFCCINYLTFDCFCFPCICYFHIKAECSLDCLFWFWVFFFSMTGLTNCSPAENACLSVNTLTRVFINISMRKLKWWPKCWVTGLQ